MRKYPSLFERDAVKTFGVIFRPMSLLVVFLLVYLASWRLLGPLMALILLPLLIVFWPYVSSFLLFSTFEGAGGIELILTIAAGGVVQMLWLGLLRSLLEGLMTRKR